MVVEAEIVEVVPSVVPTTRLVLDPVLFAMAGRAVALRTSPPTSRPSELTTTDRRGRRRRREEPRGLPRFFCPCVMLVMEQLSRTQTKVLPTLGQHLLNSRELSSKLLRKS